VPGAAAVAEGEAAPDRVDNAGREPFCGPPAPPPGGGAAHGSQTDWNLASGFRLVGDAGVTAQLLRAPHEPSRLLPFDNAPFRVPTLPSTSLPRPKSMTRTPPSSVRAAPPEESPATRQASSSPVAGAPQLSPLPPRS